MSVYERWGLLPIINAAGAVTRLGAPVPPAVWKAHQAAATDTVPIEQLQGAASRVIAQVTGAEAGLVTCGAAAALTLGAAAILTGLDPAKMERLPNCEGAPHEFVIARSQRNGYDHAVRAAGARLVEVGMDERLAGAGVRQVEAWEYEAAFHQNTAGVIYFFTRNSQPPLEEVVEIAHAHKLPVLVDAAAQLPPRANLMLASITGADLVVYSGGKAIRGPQATGILCGRRSLVAAAAMQMMDMDEPLELWDPPSALIERSELRGLPRHGIGRSMKVSKEGIVALMTALELFASGEYERERAAQIEYLQSIADLLHETASHCAIRQDHGEEATPQLEIQIEDRCTHSALEVCRRLRQGDPPIFVGTSCLNEGKLVIDPLCLTEDTAGFVGQRLREVIGS